MGGRVKKRGKTPTSAITSITHFYPMYVGWTSSETPIFTTPTAALCYQLSRYLRDALCHSPNEPTWLRCVGGLAIPDSNASLLEGSIKSTSSIENRYFGDVQVFLLNPTLKRQRSLVLKIPDDIFTSCRNTLKSMPDYQSSAGSIYKPHATAIDVLCTTTMPSQEGMSLTRDNTTGLINNGFYSRKALKAKKQCSNVDDIVARIKHQCTEEDTSITVSICSGMGITELQSCSLCLCLDKDKRSLQAGVMAKKVSPKNRAILDKFDYSSNLKDLLAAISKSLELEVKILLQHPSPSSNGTCHLLKACQDIIDCMEDGVVSTLCFVYDHSPKKNTWSKSTLLRRCIPNTLDTNKFGITDEVCISEKGDMIVDHPLFGKTQRFGWAKTRNSNEMSFTIFTKV